MSKDIFPVFHQILNRRDKEKFLNQHAKVIWLTGLSGSGKTTIARNIELELNKKGFFTQVLDGDNMRSGLNKNLGFSQADRLENIRRIAEVTSLFLNCGVICINAFITPTHEIRDIIHRIIKKEDIIDIFVNAPVELCEQRDEKGLYEKARKGIIKDFTGVNAPFEPPMNPDIEINTGILSIEESLAKCLEVILPKVTRKS